MRARCSGAAITLVRCSLVLLLACEFPTRSERYACETTADCEQGRTCDRGYCVLGDNASEVDAGSAAMADAPPADADIATLLATNCPPAGYTYNAGVGGYYRLITTNANWTTAQATCAGHVPGSTHLIVLSTSAEASFAGGQLTGTQVAWVGLSARAIGNQFVNVTGETPDVRPWEPGEPNNSGGNQNNCAVIATDGQLRDRSCGDTYDYVCECDGRMSLP